MKIVALVHFAVPYRMAGSETMLHAMLKQLHDKGHEVVGVVTEIREAPTSWVVDGVTYRSRHGNAAVTETRRIMPDVIISHHQNVTWAMRIADTTGSRICTIIHNDFDTSVAQVQHKPDLTVFNTNWIADKLANLGGPHIVVHPPVYADDHKTKPGNHITLVNLNEHKGAFIFGELARRLPDLKFLGVVGAHGVQKTDMLKKYPNVTIVPQTTDMKSDVWSRTGVLLMPSVYESYGMAGVEALASGIPVMANPTPGLTESLGDAGIFNHRDRIEDWEDTLRSITSNQDMWLHWSRRARKRSAAVEAQRGDELSEWAAAVEALGNKAHVPSPARTQRLRPKPPAPPQQAADEPSVSLVVPWRPQPDREHLWSWLRRYYEAHLPWWEIIEADNAGEWNKPTAVNAGVVKAQGDIVMVMDADALIEPVYLRAAAKSAIFAPWVVPHGKVLRLRPEPTETILSMDPPAAYGFPHTPTIRSPYLGMAGGGCFAMRRDLFFRIGGMDSEFQGWGGEDHAFGLAADTLLGKHVRYHHVPYVHLFHDPGKRYQDPHYSDNVRLLNQYIDADGDPTAMAALCHTEVKPIASPIPERPGLTATAEEWLTYLNYLGVHPDPSITHQRVALTALAVQAEHRRA